MMGSAAVGVCQKKAAGGGQAFPSLIIDGIPATKWDIFDWPIFIDH